MFRSRSGAPGGRRSRVEQQLVDVSDRLRRARSELAVIEQQLVVVADEADDLRVRALVSDGPADRHEHRDASRHAEALARSKRELTDTIDALLRRQDELLAALPSSSPTT